MLQAGAGAIENQSASCKLPEPSQFIRQPQKKLYLRVGVLFREKLFKYVIGSGNQAPTGNEKAREALAFISARSLIYLCIYFYFKAALLCISGPLEAQLFSRQKT